MSSLRTFFSASSRSTRSITSRTIAATLCLGLWGVSTNSLLTDAQRARSSRLPFSAAASRCWLRGRRPSFGVRLGPVGRADAALRHLLDARDHLQRHAPLAGFPAFPSHCRVGMVRADADLSGGFGHRPPLL